MTERTPLPVFLNLGAGGAGTKGSAAKSDAEADMTRRLAEHDVVARTKAVDPAELQQRLRALGEQDVVAIAGGDGTMRTAAEVLAGSDTTLAPIPAGRLNHFARRNGIETVEAAAKAVREGHTRLVPVGRANDELFLNTAVIGGYHKFIGLRERLRPKLSTWPAAFAASLVILARWPLVELTARTPDRRLKSTTTMLWAGIGHGSFPAPHRAPLIGPDAELEVVLLRGPRAKVAAKVVRTAALYPLKRRAAIHGPLELLHVPWIEIDAEVPIPLSLDGEPRTVDQPIRLNVESGALKVVAPGS